MLLQLTFDGDHDSFVIVAITKCVSTYTHSYMNTLKIEWIYLSLLQKTKSGMISVTGYEFAFCELGATFNFNQKSNPEKQESKAKASVRHSSSLSPSENKYVVEIV